MKNATLLFLLGLFTTGCNGEDSSFYKLTLLINHPPIEVKVHDNTCTPQDLKSRAQVQLTDMTLTTKNGNEEFKPREWNGRKRNVSLDAEGKFPPYVMLGNFYTRSLYDLQNNQLHVLFPQELAPEIHGPDYRYFDAQASMELDGIEYVGNLNLLFKYDEGFNEEVRDAAHIWCTDERDECLNQDDYFASILESQNEVTLYMAAAGSKCVK